MARRIGIKIAKGVRINFNKRGPSLSVSHKNIFGRRTSTTIPLTPKLSVSSGRRSTSSRTNVNPVPVHLENFDFSIKDDGTAVFYDSQGRQVYDESLIRKLKATDSFKRQKAYILEKRKEEEQENFAREQNEKYRSIQAKTDSVITIYKQSEYVYSKVDYKLALDKIIPRKYTCDVYTEAPPAKDGLRYLLYNKAETEVKAPFWKKKKAMEQYVEDNLEQCYNERVAEYNERKAEFERKEEEKAQKKNQWYEEDAEKKRNEIRKFFIKSPEYIENSFEEWLKEITLTVDFSVDFEYDSESGTVKLDLGLPDIESMPDQKAVKLASGAVKEKSKTQKEKKQEYIQCVFGLAVFIISHLFNISLFIKQVVVSGFVNRRDDKTGEIKNECVYSFIVSRADIEDIKLNETDPQQFCLSLENSRCNITASLIMKSVTPY